MGVTDFLRKFDLYKKVPHDLTKGTISGAVISVICVAITVYLLFAELVLYSNGSLKTSVFVSYLNHEDKIPVRLNLTIKNQPCGKIGVDIKDANGRYEDNVANVVHMQKGKHCNLYGIIKINKTPGLIMINQIDDKGKDGNGMDNDKTEAKMEDEKPKEEYTVEKTEAAKKQDAAAAKKAQEEGVGKLIRRVVFKNIAKNSKSVDHVIHDLAFGDHVPLERKWKEIIPAKAFNVLSGITRDTEINVSHDYHLKLVPTTFVDQNKRTFQSFQFSYAYQNFVLMTPAGLSPPAIIFRYEISAMEIKYQYTRKPLYHLLTMMCAIIGGIVTVAGVVDKILFNTQQMLMKIDLGKAS